MATKQPRPGAAAPHEIPDQRNELRDLIYRLGVRALSPEPKDPKQARAVEGHRLYRLVKTWRDKDLVATNLENMSATRAWHFACTMVERCCRLRILKAVDEGLKPDE